MKFLEMNKIYRTTFTLNERVGSVIGAFSLAFLLFCPLFVALGEFLVVYMYLLYPIVILMIASGMAFFVTWFHLIKKAFLLKKPDIRSTFAIDKYFFIVLAVIEGVALVVGLVFLFILIPMWLV